MTSHTAGSLAAVALASLLASGRETPDGTGLPLTGKEAERFLRSAEVLAVEDIPEGVTQPRKVTLGDGRLVAHAIFKTIDETRSGIVRYSTGEVDLNFRDSFKNEIAAYELDVLLDARLVPPTVERYIDAERGSLQLWVEDAITEIERRKLGKVPPTPLRFSEQILKVELFRSLTHDVDASNFANILVDGAFQVYAIDHSRSFRLRPELVRGEHLRRFSRALLKRLRELDRATLDDALHKWLSGIQIEALLKRRDLIVERADRLVRDWGEDSILY